MDGNNIKKRKYWKGNLVSDSVYNKRLKQSENGKKRKKQLDVPDVEEVRTDANDSTEFSFPIKGCRIFNVEYIAKLMFCNFCKKPLQLINTIKEIQKGLASKLQIKCEQCLLINDVLTSPTHINTEGTKIKHDINSQAALACLHAGLGHSHINKFLNIMDIPALSSVTYKKHEREMGKIVESVAKDSCVKAAKKERSLTIEKALDLEKILPEDRRGGFFTPGNDPCNVKDDNVVRIMGSLDMGYSGRGNGYTYDSANGYSSMIGAQSGLIISYDTTNRICRFCDAGHPKDDHDCRLNFYGSAKAMEAHSAVKLVADNPILKEQNIEAGIFIGDNDSSSMSAIRQVASHPVLKLSDQNHTSKGVKNMLYKLKTKNLDPDKELTNDSITYLHRCFSYALAQNINEIAALAAAIENIPYHAFNKHDNCGNWCGFIKNPETYKHRSVLGGFKNSVLFDALVSEFKKLASNAQQFVGGASTQANESVNSIMARKAPKSMCYSVSESCDFRYGCTVLQKNEGEGYLSQVIKKTSIPVGHNFKKLIASTEKISEKRKIIRKTPQYKKTRRENKKIRSQLRFRREATEIDTYESNIGLFPDESDKENSPPIHNQIPKKIVSDKYSIVYFDLETAGFHMTDDILQIALKSSNQTFSQYITPTKQICTHASESNGLTSHGEDLFYYGRKVLTVSLSVALQKLLTFLKTLKNPCIMVAHNCPFDAPRLLRAIQNESMIDDFRTIMKCFQDTLKLFKRQFPERKENKQLSLTTLASETLSLCTKRAHNAEYDVYMLEELVEKHLTSSDIINDTLSFDEILKKLSQQVLSSSIIPSFKPLENLISPIIIKRLSIFGIDYDLILKTFKEHGTDNTIKLLQHEDNGVPQVIKTKKIMQIILNHCQKVISKK